MCSSDLSQPERHAEGRRHQEPGSAGRIFFFASADERAGGDAPGDRGRVGTGHQLSDDLEIHFAELPKYTTDTSEINFRNREILY